MREANSGNVIKRRHANNRERQKAREGGDRLKSGTRNHRYRHSLIVAV